MMFLFLRLVNQKRLCWDCKYQQEDKKTKTKPRQVECQWDCVVFIEQKGPAESLGVLIGELLEIPAALALAGGSIKVRGKKKNLIVTVTTVICIIMKADEMIRNLA